VDVANLERERAALIVADRHIAEGEARIAAQERVLARMTARGQSTGNAERFMAALRDALTNWHLHRTLILDAIERESRRQNIVTLAVREH
jgi:hypothetical protein